MARKSFNVQLNESKDMPKIITLTDPKSIKVYGGTEMLIAPPIAYDEVIRKVPEGKLITAEKIRAYLAKAHGAHFTCPLTAGIFINIAAHASEERANDPTPYWRVLRKDGELNPKYPGGIEAHKEKLIAEGHKLYSKGRTNIRYFVEDYEKSLIELE